MGDDDRGAIVDYSFLKRIREQELMTVLPHLKSGSSILEIGAGAGWQAKMFAEKGFAVQAIDIEASSYRDTRVWPVIDYDGKTLPFPDAHFDAVYTSHVLEHVPDLRGFFNEVRRVLRPNGIFVAVLPSPTWRLWTTLTYYPWLLGVAARYAARLVKPASVTDTTVAKIQQARNRDGLLRMMLRASLPMRHGESGNALTEVYLFSGLRWRKVFSNLGFQLKRSSPCRLFFTGYFLVGSRMGLGARRVLSFLLGSSSVVYVMEPK